MGCTTCTTPKDGIVTGCQSKGGCSSGGCNRMNVFDWFADMPISFNENFNIVEVSFKKGARKGFYRNNGKLELAKGQLVVVEAAQGYDVGEVSLQGELVKAQMKKRKITERDDTIRNILRIANEQDATLLQEIRAKEQETMIRARAISHSIKLQMKIGDVEYQADNKKVTIFYTADDRVDFRELVKVYAREFKVKIEMRQIGARQESGRIGGIGTCGRELCCSSWLNDFKSVTTQSIRYQNLAINTDKMSGQCGRLKCCLNYELDTYNDALKTIPRGADKIDTEAGMAYLKKTEILKKQMWYELESNRGTFFKLSTEDVKELLWMNKNGKKPASLEEFSIIEEEKVDESKHEDLVGQVSLSTLEEKDRKKRRSGSGGGNRNQRSGGSGNRQENSNRQQGDTKHGGGQDTPTTQGTQENQGDNKEGGNKGGGNRHHHNKHRNKKK